ncbi:DUF6959 family protein [Yinghuangia sp. YIM S10712]|uniref:DUF6959 family protein n=1 Tax=Yinghuangia sp. YIM S10712 TaxID=3436930 RepID=UPI003F535020
MSSDGRLDRIEAKLCTDRGNEAVVRMPSRRSPGVAIQEDPLSTLRSSGVSTRRRRNRGAREAAGFIFGACMISAPGQRP